MSVLVERFLKYVSFDTQSDPNTGLTPSTPGQKVFAYFLAEELKRIGISDVSVDSNGYLTATVPANIPDDIPVIGFLAHMDTSPDFTGKQVSPKIFENYNGKELVLNEQERIVLKPDEFPELLLYKGDDLITSDGTTLLGADDKAGIAEIVTAMEFLIQNPEIRHGRIRICFTPDEEIGQGADNFNVKEFGADFAFTIDGGEIGELQFENFNAAFAKVIINGRNVHPGYAFNKMKNSIKIANHFIRMFPAVESPEQTKGLEGFFHLISFNGNVEQTELQFIIRDFDQERFLNRKLEMEGFVEKINSLFGHGTAVLEMNDQYYNMREKIEPVMYIVELAKAAMDKAGVNPIIRPIRGGTDGARLSFMGLPTPNIFSGGHNFHGRYEFIPVQSMEKAVDVIVNTVKLLPIFHSTFKA